MRLATLGLTLSGGSLANVLGAGSDSLSAVANVIIAVTGLIAAISAFALGWQQRHRADPRDKLIEMLLDERQEKLNGGDGTDEPEPKPRPRTRRRRT